MALAIVTFASQALPCFAGAPGASANAVVPAPSSPPPASFFRAKAWDVAAFATYHKAFDQNRRALGEHAWGGGLGIGYFPWRYAGFKIQGEVVNTMPGDNTSGQVEGDVLLRYPLDLLKPNLHVAPYADAGVGACLVSAAGWGGWSDGRSRFSEAGERTAS